MDDTQSDEPDRAIDESAGSPAAPADDSVPKGGMEVNLGDFTRTQSLMKSLRLLVDNQIVVQVEELASGVSEAGRKFKLGDIEQANIDVARLYAAFGQKTNQWESQARGLEQQLKMQAAKNPKSISIDRMNRMKSEQTAVRTRIRTADVQFRRLHQGLDQAFTNLQLQRPAAAELPSSLPADFLISFQAAALADRAELVKAWFEIEAVLRVEITRGAKSGYDIKFTPLPPVDRHYFLTPSGQFIRLEQLGNLVVVHDVETDQRGEVKLVDFVKQVQSGVWLLGSIVERR